MNKKSKQLTALTLSSLGLVSGLTMFEQEAKANVFADNDKLELIVNAVVGNISGVAGNPIDFFFPAQPAGTLNPLGIGGSGNAGGPGSFGVCNSGGPFSTTCTGEIRSANVFVPLGSLDPLDDEYLILAESTSGDEWITTLNFLPTPPIVEFNQVGNAPGTGNALVNVNLIDAVGLVKNLVTGDIADVRYDVSFESLELDGVSSLGSCSLASPCSTIESNVSGSMIVTVTPVPESSNLLGILGIGSLGMIGLRKKASRK